MTPEETEPPMELAGLQARLSPGSELGATAAPKVSEGAPDTPLAVPERVPLSMQAQPPRYLTPRDALRLRRWKSANSTSAP